MVYHSYVNSLTFLKVGGSAAESEFESVGVDSSDRSRSRFLKAGVGVGVTENQSTPQPWEGSFKSRE